MNAREIMSHDVVTVAPNAPLRDVARMLLTHRISAVPVVDVSGAPVGMISEGDLIGRKKTEREERREWWLMRLAEGEPLSEDFVAHQQSPLAVADEIMTAPVVTVSETTSADEIAGLMATHRVKRVPVVRDGRIVGIVRRADILRLLGGGSGAPVPLPQEPANGAEIPEADGDGYPQNIVVAATRNPANDEISADAFRHLAEQSKEEADLERLRLREAEAVERRRQVMRLRETHFAAAAWLELMHGARDAAERGATEFLLLRFPSQLCSDGGRAINAPDPEWPRTLCGEAAEIYLRWERELRLKGFRIAARVVEFPDGVPGDVGLYLEWDG